MQRIPMTKEGAASLKEELDHLKNEARPRISKAIAEARAHGDLKENAEYHAAREQQGMGEARIRDIEYKLSNNQVIDTASMPNTGKVIFGTTVTLLNTDNDEEVTYKIVGEDEADIKLNKISVTSPVASAMIGKMVDDEVMVLTPSGEQFYEIIKVEHV